MAVELDARAAGAHRLKDKVCVVTGAGQGIGRATARRLGQEGGKIVVADRVDDSVTRTETELRDHGINVVKALVDLSTFAGAQDLMTQAQKAYGRIDVLVNNVGGTIWIKPYHLYTEEEVKLELERSLYPNEQTISMQGGTSHSGQKHEPDVQISRIRLSDQLHRKAHGV